MTSKDLELKISKLQKEQKRREKRHKRKQPEYKGHHFRNWLVFPIGVLSVELDLAADRRYQALKWSTTKAEEIINKYLIDICNYDEETGELSFSTDWWLPWAANASKKDKSWCRKFNHELTKYLIDTYECSDFKKTVEDDWIIFTKQYC